MKITKAHEGKLLTCTYNDKVRNKVEIVKVIDQPDDTLLKVLEGTNMVVTEAHPEGEPISVYRSYKLSKVLNAIIENKPKPILVDEEISLV